MTRSQFYRKTGRFAALGSLLALLAACASGPTDLPGFLSSIEPAQPSQPVAQKPETVARNRDALLGVAQQRSSTAKAGVGDSLPSAMALAIIRQQQQEEARRLLAETGAVENAPTSDVDTVAKVTE